MTQQRYVIERAVVDKRCKSGRRWLPTPPRYFTDRAEGEKRLAKELAEGTIVAGFVSSSN